MVKSIMYALFDKTKMQCTVCGLSGNICFCWKKCTRPGCTWSYRNIKGGKCSNPDHYKKRNQSKVQPASDSNDYSGNKD